MKGEGPGTIATLFLLAFLGVQFLLIGYFIYLARGTRLAASCLGMFCIMYSLHAWLVAAMSFSDTWL
jgi:hypothetical protein